MALPTDVASLIDWTYRVVSNGPFLSSSDNVYIVGRSAADDTAIRVIKATDPTTSFSTAATDTAGTNTIEAFDVKQDGDDLHILHQENTFGGGDVAYCRFSMSSDSFTQSRVVVRADPDDGMSCALGLRADGDLVAIYQGNNERIMGADYARLVFKVSTDNGATWGSETEYGAGGKDVELDYAHASIELGDSDTLHAVYRQGTNLMQRALSSADALQTERDTGFDIDFVIAPRKWIFKGQRFSRSSTTRLRFPYIEDTTKDLEVLRFDAAADPATFNSDNVDGTNDVFAAGLAVDGSIVHALWQSLSDGDIYTDNDEGADTWDSATKTFTAAFSGGSSIVCNANVYTRGGTKVLAHIFLDNTGGFKFYYDEDSLGGGSLVHNSRRRAMRHNLVR